jgi:hypothetical protein
VIDHERIRLGITERGGVTIQDRGGILPGFPAVVEALHAWIDDPAPKLAGLSLRFREYPSGGIEFDMRHHSDGLIFSVHRVVSGLELARCRDVPGLSWHHFQAAHLGLIEEIRHRRDASVSP